jgi:transposase
LGVRIGTLSEWNRIFDEKMLPLIVPDGRGKKRKITPDMVRQIVEVAKERKSKGLRIRLKSFTKQLTAQEDIVLSSKKVGEILIANGLYNPEIRRRRPRFYQALRQGIPNGLISVDGSEFTVWINQIPYKFNLELAVDVESYCHTGFSISDSETSGEFIKVIEAHKKSWGTPTGLVSDHGSANLSDESRAYLQVNDIEALPAGPANPKGDGTVEGAFSEMKRVIGTIGLETLSPRNLAKAILEKVISIYIAMRNRLPRVGDKIAPGEAMKAQIPEEKRQALKERYKVRKQKYENPDQETKLGRLAWIIQNHGLEVDERSLKRAEKCVITYDLNAINKSEDAFLKAIRRDQQRCTLPYFFGILNNIQNDLDTARHEVYCRERYYYQGMLDKEREEQEKAKETATVENLVAMLRNAILSGHRFIKDTCVRQAKRMAADLKKQYHYEGALKKQILDELVNFKELRIDQRKEAINLMELVLS